MLQIVENFFEPLGFALLILSHRYDAAAVAQLGTSRAGQIGHVGAQLIHLLSQFLRSGGSFIDIFALIYVGLMESSSLHFVAGAFKGLLCASNLMFCLLKSGPGRDPVLTG